MPEKCKTCGGSNTYYREAHADTGLDEIELRCLDCEAKIPKLPLSFRLKEKASIIHHRLWGRFVIKPLLRLMRWSTKQTFGYCHICGCEAGFRSSYSKEGFFCTECRNRYYS